MQNKLSITLSPARFFLPRNNHWLKRTVLVFAFILFDYFSTLAFCRASYEEANMFARTFMGTFGIPVGLTFFVFVANLPIYMTLILDSHIVKLPFRLAVAIETFVDLVFAWFIAGPHFSGGASWFWHAQDLMRQSLGALLYLVIAFLVVRPYEPCHDN